MLFYALTPAETHLAVRSHSACARARTYAHSHGACEPTSKCASQSARSRVPTDAIAGTP